MVAQGSNLWYEMQDLHVREIQPQMITLAESYIQVLGSAPCCYCLSCLAADIPASAAVSLMVRVRVNEHNIGKK